MILVIPGRSFTDTIRPKNSFRLSIIQPKANITFFKFFPQDKVYILVPATGVFCSVAECINLNMPAPKHG